MHISRVVIQNYRRLEAFEVELNPKLNIVVGDNESGKSTFLEAVNLALTFQVNGRSLHTELHPHLFNADAVDRYLQLLRDGTPSKPPSILIEVYFGKDPVLARLRGSNNSRGEDVPGVRVLIEYSELFNTEYAAYIAKPELIRTIPVEYYRAHWFSFADEEITWRSIPMRPSFIDATTIRNDFSANRYVVDMIKTMLEPKEQVDLALSYRLMKDRFLGEEKIKAINDKLAAKKGDISNKVVSVSLDTSSRASWEMGVIPHLDDIPMPLVGKGEQNSVKIKLAMEAAEDSHLFLVEEPENHLSFSNLNALIKSISDKRADKQLIITTHSSFVLNKLGVESVLLFANNRSITLKAVSPETHDYFLKLPGHETLRLILAKRAILVEGPSDELVVQKAFVLKHGSMPLEAGVDVITVNSLAFKRFLEIATMLGTQVDVLTDNDGDVDALKTKYADYLGTAAKPHIRINFDEDVAYKTLEPQLLKANGLKTMNQVLGTTYATEAELLKFMEKNKTECALRFFEAKTAWKAPEYVERAIG